jgi:hypothetical protein
VRVRRTSSSTGSAPSTATVPYIAATSSQRASSSAGSHQAIVLESAAPQLSARSKKPRLSLARVAAT